MKYPIGIQQFDKLREDGWDLNILKDTSMSPAKVNGQTKEEAYVMLRQRYDGCLSCPH